MNVKTQQRGFTLTELVVVILIAVILGTLIWMGVAKVLRNRKVSMVKAEMAALELAIEAYKQKFGHYPPDNPGDTRHHSLFYELSGTLLEEPTADWPVLLHNWPGHFHARNLPHANPIEESRVMTTWGRGFINTADVPDSTYVLGASVMTDRAKTNAMPWGITNNLLGKQVLLRHGDAPLLRNDPSRPLDDRRTLIFKPGDFPKLRLNNFIPTWKRKQWITINNGPWQHFTFLKVPTALAGNETNLWHYRVTKPEHNPKSFDLWAEFGASDAKQVIGNWKEK